MSLILAIWAHCSSTVCKDSTSGDRSVTWKSLNSRTAPRETDPSPGSPWIQGQHLGRQIRHLEVPEFKLQVIHDGFSRQPSEKDEIRATSHELFTYRLLIFWCNSIIIHDWSYEKYDHCTYQKKTPCREKDPQKEIHWQRFFTMDRHCWWRFPSGSCRLSCRTRSPPCRTVVLQVL